MARMKGPPNTVGETFRQIRTRAGKEPSKVRKSRSESVLDLLSNTWVPLFGSRTELRAISAVVPWEGNVDGGLGSDVADIIHM